MMCWCGYLSGARCKWFARSSWCHCSATSSAFAVLTRRMVYVSGAGLRRLPLKRSHQTRLLWPPCIADANIIFFSVVSLYLPFFFLPRLISVVTDWMSTILRHMMWPWCKFRMHVWNVLHAARWKYRTQKNHHLCTIAQHCRAISSQLRHVSTIRKKHVKQQYLPHTSSQYGEVWSTSGWDPLSSLGHPCKFQRVSRLCIITAWHSSSGRQANLLALNRGRHLYSAGRPSRWANNWPTFLVFSFFCCIVIYNMIQLSTVRPMNMHQQWLCSPVWSTWFKYMHIL